MRIVETVVAVNDARKQRMARKIVEACGGTVDNKTIAILGLTFKPNTDDMREAPSLEIVPALQAAGASIRAFDPAGMDQARERLRNVIWCEDAYHAMDGADALAILTEWNEFRALNLDRMKALLRSPIVIDLRNVYSPCMMAAAGFRHTTIGRAAIRRDNGPADESKSEPTALLRMARASG